MTTPPSQANASVRSSIHNHMDVCTCVFEIHGQYKSGRGRWRTLPSKLCVCIKTCIYIGIRIYVCICIYMYTYLNLTGHGSTDEVIGILFYQNHMVVCKYLHIS